jgi:hypothetical protein
MKRFDFCALLPLSAAVFSMESAGAANGMFQASSIFT